MNAILQSLRELPTLITARSVKPHMPFSLVEGGLPQGSLVEISGKSGSGKTEAIIKFIAENPEKRVAWVEEEFNAYPLAFAQNQIDLERVLFIEAGAERLWTTHQLLRCQLFEIIVLHSSCSQIELRRLQLAAEKANATVILLREAATEEAAWPISVQARSRRDFSGEPALEILRHRGKLCG